MCSEKATKKGQVVKMHQHDEEEEDDDDDGAATQRGKPNREKKMADLTTEIVDSHGIDELKMRNGLGLILTWMDMT